MAKRYRSRRSALAVNNVEKGPLPNHPFNLSRPLLEMLYIQQVDSRPDGPKCQCLRPPPLVEVSSEEVATSSVLIWSMVPKDPSWERRYHIEDAGVAKWMIRMMG